MGSRGRGHWGQVVGFRVPDPVPEACGRGKAMSVVGSAMGLLRVPRQPGLHSELQISLKYTERHCLKKAVS